MEVPGSEPSGPLYQGPDVWYTIKFSAKKKKKKHGKEGGVCGTMVTGEGCVVPW